MKTTQLYGILLLGTLFSAVVAAPVDSGDNVAGEEPVFNTLLASTYLGGSDNEFHYGLDTAVGEDGAVYVACRTQSSDFPATPSAYDPSYNGGTDIVVARFSAGLTTLEASTFLGGSGTDDFPRIVIDGDGCVIVSGMTYSVDFPTTPGAYDRSPGGSADAFVCRLDPGLTALLASTYLGGGGAESFPDVALDASGHVFVAGITSSPAFPTLPGAFDTSYNGDDDFFVAKLPGDLSALLGSTYLGGQYTERFAAVEVDGAGRVFVSGATESHDFPATPGAYDPSFNGPDLNDPDNQDVFISRFDNGLTTLSASTFVGTAGFEMASELALDEYGDVYVSGHTTSAAFPTTPGAYDRTFNGYNDGFVAKLDAGLVSLAAATFLSGNTGSFAMAGDAECGPGGLFYLCGHTGHSDFPTTGTAYDRTYNGGVHDQIVMMFKDDLKTLQYSTFVGGSGEEGMSAIVPGGTGNVWLFGSTASTDFPTTPGAYDEDHNGGTFDKYVLELGPVPTAVRHPGRLDGVRLDRAAPNPFNPSTAIRFYLPEAANVELTIYSVRGRAVVTLIDGGRPAGPHTVFWNGENENGAAVVSGAYYCRLRVTVPDGRAAVRATKLMRVE